MLFNILWTYPKSENQSWVLKRGHVLWRNTVGCSNKCYFTWPPAGRIRAWFFASRTAHFVIPPPPQPSLSTFRFLFAVSSQIFAVEQFKIRRWKANEQTNLMISFNETFKNRTSTARDIAQYVWPNLNLEEKLLHHSELFAFFSS